MVHNIDKKVTEHAQLMMFVIDVLRYDVEPIPSIVKLLNNWGSIGWRSFWPHDFTEEEVIPALEELLREGMVQPIREDETLGVLVPMDTPVDIRQYADTLWFTPTEKGWHAWEEWHPPEESGKREDDF